MIRLQAFVRRWLAQQMAARLRRERDRRLAWQEEQLRRRREEQKEELLERHRRWSNPQRRADFNQLYRSVASKPAARAGATGGSLLPPHCPCLSGWRAEVEQQICASLTGAEKTAALCSLLRFETEQIAAIERRQIAARASNHDSSARRLLDKVRGHRVSAHQPSLGAALTRCSFRRRPATDGRLPAARRSWWRTSRS